jgi:hypothetical protein
LKFAQEVINQGYDQHGFSQGTKGAHFKGGTQGSDIPFYEFLVDIQDYEYAIVYINIKKRTLLEYFMGCIPPIRGGNPSLRPKGTLFMHKASTKGSCLGFKLTQTSQRNVYKLG